MPILNMTELNRVRDECRSMVTKRSVAAGATSAIPGAAVGVAADVGLLLEMLPKINRAFGLDPQQIDELDEQMKQQFFVIAGNTTAHLVGKAITKEMILVVLKRVGVRATAKMAASWVPFVGNGVAAVLGFGMMKIVGNNHINDCYRIAQRMIEERDRLAPAGSTTVPATAA